MPSWLLLGSFGQTWTIFIDRNTNFNINSQIFPVAIQLVRADGQPEMAEVISEFCLLDATHAQRKVNLLSSMVSTRFSAFRAMNRFST